MRALSVLFAAVLVVGCQKSTKDTSGDDPGIEDPGNADGNAGTDSDEGTDVDADADDGGSNDTAAETGTPSDTAPPTDTAAGDTAAGDTAATDTAATDTAATDTASGDTAAGDTGELVADSDGDGFTILTGDCDDSDDSVHPDAVELCDTIDNDCDGDIDEADASDAGIWFVDADEDGFGDPDSSVSACALPEGHVENSDDCNDEDADIKPDGVEVCDEADNDCDGEIDEADATDAGVWFADGDSDGFGDLATSVTSCVAPDGYVENSEDCDDDDNDIHPDAVEVCDEEDNDCDGDVDEGDSSDGATWFADEDEDGFGDVDAPLSACALPDGHVENSDDCNDSDPAIKPGAEEVCDEVDNDCDGETDEADSTDALTWFADGDGDGFGDADSPTNACALPPGHVENSEDCDDNDNDIHPDGIEVCDDEDNDCDEVIDEDDAVGAPTWYTDADEDGFGDAESTAVACSAPAATVDNDTDCLDSDPLIHPDGIESCDTVDNDCDGEVDEGEAEGSVSWYADYDADGFGNPAVSVLACAAPAAFTADNTDCDDADNDIHPDADEQCDGEDNNCDGVIDDPASADALTWYADADGDGFGNPAVSVLACAAPDGHIADNNDCDDAESDIHPDADEACDGVDNNCDSEVDESTAVDAQTFYVDADEDGFGDAASPVSSCSVPAGAVDNDDDCDDALAGVHPDAEETCNSIDDDCDGVVDGPDSTDAVEWYADNDGDGFGDSESVSVSCSVPDGHVADDTDCDDSEDDNYPGAPEYCDGVDNDCDGSVDEDASVDAETFFEDGDGDGFGDAASPVVGCSAPVGTVSNDDDCDDSAGGVHPDADEVCNGFDDDCDGDIDEADAVDASMWFADDDGDTFGDASTVTSSCSVPDGYVDNDTDCDDTEESTYPGALEYCDGVDNNCDGLLDEDTSVDAEIFFLDADGDGFGHPAETTEACTVPDEYVVDATDCDDGNPDVYPGATEFCDGFDNNCDDVIDPDDSVDALSWFLDADGDTYGDPLSGVMACDAPDGTIEDDSDCDDTRPAVSPEGIESCNGLDDNCDGSVDEGTDGECEFGACIEGTCATDCEPGKQDMYFGEAGFVVHDMGGGEDLNDMTTDELGRIVLTGGAGTSNFETLRFTSNGLPDSSFGGDGRVSTSFPVHAASNAIDIDSEGRIVVVGSTHISCSMTWNRYALARYLEDGSLDPSFGDGGLQTTNWGSVGTSLRDIEFQSDGKIVVSGTRYAGGCSPGITNSTVTRYTVDGQLDTSFGSGGEMRRDIPHGPHHDGNNGLALDSSDNLWATGADGYWSWAGLHRYTSSGSFLWEDTISTGYATAGGVEFNGVDRIIAATTDHIVQYGLDGIKVGWPADPSSYSVDTSPAPFESTPSSMTLDDEGRILILSKSSTSFRIVRYLTTGVLDSSFGVGGIAEISPGHHYFRAGAISVQPDGYIVVGGTAEVTPGDRDFALVRLCE